MFSSFPYHPIILLVCTCSAQTRYILHYYSTIITVETLPCGTEYDATAHWKVPGQAMADESQLPDGVDEAGSPPPQITSKIPAPITTSHSPRHFLSAILTIWKEHWLVLWRGSCCLRAWALPCPLPCSDSPLPSLPLCSLLSSLRSLSPDQHAIVSCTERQTHYETKGLKLGGYTPGNRGEIQKLKGICGSL